MWLRVARWLLPKLISYVTKRLTMPENTESVTVPATVEDLITACQSKLDALTKEAQDAHAAAQARVVAATAARDVAAALLAKISAQPTV